MGRGVLATWVIRSKIRDFRQNGFSLRSNCSLTRDAGSWSPSWCELPVSLERTTSFRNSACFRQTSMVDWLFEIPVLQLEENERERNLARDVEKEEKR